MPGNVLLSPAFSPAVSNTDETTHDLYAKRQQTFTEKPISNCVLWATRFLAQTPNPAGPVCNQLSITCKWMDVAVLK